MSPRRADFSETPARRPAQGLSSVLAGAAGGPQCPGKPNRTRGRSPTTQPPPHLTRSPPEGFDGQLLGPSCSFSETKVRRQSSRTAVSEAGGVFVPAHAVLQRDTLRSDGVKPGGRRQQLRERTCPSSRWARRTFAGLSVPGVWPAVGTWREVRAIHGVRQGCAGCPRACKLRHGSRLSRERDPCASCEVWPRCSGGRRERSRPGTSSHSPPCA